MAPKPPSLSKKNPALHPGINLSHRLEIQIVGFETHRLVRLWSVGDTTGSSESRYTAKLCCIIRLQTLHLTNFCAFLSLGVLQSILLHSIQYFENFWDTARSVRSKKCRTLLNRCIPHQTHPPSNTQKWTRWRWRRFDDGRRRFGKNGRRIGEVLSTWPTRNSLFKQKKVQNYMSWICLKIGSNVV